MRNKICLVVLLAALYSTIALAQQSLDSLIDRDIASLVTTYKTLHAAPELFGKSYAIRDRMLRPIPALFNFFLG